MDHDDEIATERADLISALFALLMVKFEEAACIAAKCQDPRYADEVLGSAHALVSLTQETVTIAKATLELVDPLRSRFERPAQ